MFSPSNPETACGIWSTTYILALISVVLLIIFFLRLSRNLKEEQVKKVLFGLAIFVTGTEVIKMIFHGTTYGIDSVDFTPFYFCSLFIYSAWFSISKNETLKKTGLSFIFYGGIVGATAFFMYPNACIPNYPIYHFMCIRTMLYHGSMIYAGILVVMRGYYKPDYHDFKYYFIFLLIISICANTSNILFGTDYMYMSKPLAFDLSIAVYNFNPTLYPYIFIILQIIAPFMLTHLIYSLCLKLNESKNKKSYN